MRGLTAELDSSEKPSSFPGPSVAAEQPTIATKDVRAKPNEMKRCMKIPPKKRGEGERSLSLCGGLVKASSGRKCATMQAEVRSNQAMLADRRVCRCHSLASNT